MSDKPETAFWLDWEYDQRSSSGGPSRYANYLRQDDAKFADIADDGPAAFARLAWRIATTPVMVPPLVHSHPRVIDVKLSHSEWNSELIADVRLVSSRPQELRRDVPTAGAIGAWWRGYRRDAWGEFEGLGDSDLSRGSYMLTEVRMLWQLPGDTLAEVQRDPIGKGDRFDQAVKCVESLVSALNREVWPVVARLDQE
ncbi:hypothetical protein AB0A95_33915 [Micromonospora sp. NPDC049230]|uniref:hypothetical protein n=1 Tax=Micromonospora sp. NPDC049230 TaxID=3155502 RepID=UPI00340FB81A